MTTPTDFPFARSIPLALLACLLCLVYLLLLARARRKIPRAALILRALTAIFATLAFLAPYYNVATATRAPILLLLDDSQSLARKVDTRTVQQDASNLAALLLRRARRRHAPVTLATLDARPLDSSDDYANNILQGARSNIASALTYCQEERYGAVILLSDGIAQPHVTPQSLRAPQPLAAPLYAVALGNSQPAYDCALQNLNWQETQQDDAARTLTAQLAVAHAQPHSTQDLTLTLWRFVPQNNSAQTCRVEPQALRRVELTCDADGNAALSVDLEALPNPSNGAFYCLTLLPTQSQTNTSVTPDAWAQLIRNACQAEASRLNNVALLPPQEPRERKVLLLEDDPRSEFRYLRQTLRRQQNLTLTTVLFNADPRLTQNDPEALAKQELPALKLEEYDLIVLGRLSLRNARTIAEPLQALMARDDNATALWLLHNAYRNDDPDAWRPLQDILPNAIAYEPIPPCENDAPYRWEISTGARAIYGETFSTRLRNAHGATLRPHDLRPTPDAATQVLLQISRDDHTTEPALLCAQLNRHKIAWLAQQELWRIQTLGEKDLYPDFIAKTLDFLTEDSQQNHSINYPPGGDTLTELVGSNDFTQLFELQEDINELINNDSAKREPIAEQTDLAASTAILDEMARLTNGKTLDLRDRSETETLDLASPFFDELLDALPTRTTSTPRRLLPPDLTAALLLTLILATWLLEKNRDFFRTNPTSKD